MTTLSSCATCHGTGWIEDAQGDPVSKCTHGAQPAASGPIPRDRPGAPGTLVGAADSDTQQAGARRGLGRAGTQRRKCYEAIKAAGQYGMTFEEVGAATSMSYSLCGPRVRELMQDGYIRRTGDTRTTTTGSEQEIHIATDQS
jgi:hypothetical protein